MEYDITFHPSWWNAQGKVDFSRNFFFDETVRLEYDREMRRLLFDKFGTWGLGEKNPEYRPILGSDLIASGFLYSEILGCEVRYSPSNPPEVVCANLPEEQAAELRVPDIRKHELWQEMEEQITRLKNRFSYVESALNLQGILNIAVDIRGEEIFLDMYQNPELAFHIFETSYGLSADIGRRLKSISKNISGGVTSIVNKLPVNNASKAVLQAASNNKIEDSHGSGLYVHSNCTVDMISQEMYEEFLLPYEKNLALLFQPYGIHHCGTSMEHVVKGYAQVEGLAFAEVGAGSDIACVREALPGIHLNLRYSPVKLAVVRENELKTDLEDMYNAAGGDSEAVSISCVGIGNEVPDHQVEMFLELCSRFN
ncbi:MAG: hypothetical protein K9L75_05815 [Spirochaetia bacterium]|nr:hypothetical protein [Spirochaetia bacterium]